ncbi:MAG: tRNA lysidine(34) synthetase TilS [Pseudomonadota bacterium]
MSGGGDSMALLDLLAGQRSGPTIKAVTLDHGLRPGAAEDIALVARYCHDRGIGHTVLHWQGAASEGNLMAAAREARYRLISAWAHEAGVEAMALGHTEDDQAETVLMRLARASGVDGLAQMQPTFHAHAMIWHRPLLAVSRADLRAYLTARGLPWREDPSNADPRFERVKARQALDVLEPLGIDRQTLAQVSRNMERARAALQHVTSAAAAQVVAVDRGDVIIDAKALGALPEEIVRRLLLAALHWITGAPYTPRAQAVAQILPALAASGRHTLAGCLLSQEDPPHGPIRITREWQAVRDTRSTSDGLWDNRWCCTGPHEPGLEVRALGDGLTTVQDWRDANMPRESLLASPAIWREGTLIAAPLAGFGPDWTAKLTKERDDFAATLY